VRSLTGIVFDMSHTLLSSPRASFFVQQYSQILELKTQVISALTQLDHAVGSSEQGGTNVSQVIELERNLVKLLQQFQAASANIQKTINQLEANAKPQQQGAQTVIKSAETSEIRMLNLMRASMGNFLVENQKLLSHYKALPILFDPILYSSFASSCFETALSNEHRNKPARSNEKYRLQAWNVGLDCKAAYCAQINYTPLSPIIQAESAGTQL